MRTSWPWSSSLYVEFGGGPEPRPVRARRAPPRRGQRVIVPATLETLQRPEVFVVFRLGAERVVVAAEHSHEAAEALRTRLGPMADAYGVAAVPVDPVG